MDFAGTGLWQDLREAPAALERTLAERAGVEEAAALLGRARRVVAIGNGAAYYVAHALWLATLESAGDGPALVALPSGLAVREGFHWHDGDALLAISSSGEFRDVVAAVERCGRPSVAVTADAGSSLARAAGVTVLQHVASQRAVTHTQALWGGYACALGVWAQVTGDRGLAAALAGAPEAGERAIAATEAWAPAALAEVTRPVAAVAAGGGAGWAAALEAALMLKEIARVPAEGVETREGATSAMFGLAPGHLMASLDRWEDPLGEEARRLCAAAGAATLWLPGAGEGDERLAPITTLPAAAALAAHLAGLGGHDVDQPAWTEAYYSTARSAP